MPPLISGSCDTCDVQDVKLRTNPFDDTEQCENCRKATIIGITDIKSEFGLKDGDLDGLTTISEAKEAFLGGPDRRWYLVDEIEKRAGEVEKQRKEEAEQKEAVKKEKEAAKKAKEAEKAAAKKAKEDAKIEKANAKKEKKEKQAAKNAEVEEEEKSAERPKEVKRKRNTEPEEEDADEEVKPAVKRGRGRPPKVGGAAQTPAGRKPVAKDDDKPKRRGRPPNAKSVEE